MRRFGNFVLSGRWQAVFAALILTLLPLVGWIGTMILGLVTLRKGPREGAVILFAVMLPDLIWAFMGYPQVLVSNVIYGSVLVYLAALVLRVWASWALVLEISAVLGLLGVLLAHLVSKDINAWWMHFYQQLLVQITELLKLVSAGEWKQVLTFYKEALEQPGVLPFLAKLSTGLSIAFNILGSLVNLVLARLWQASLFNPGGLRKELYQIRLHPVCVVVLFVCVFGLALGLNLAWDLLPVVLLVFFSAAISLVHSAAATRIRVWLWLTIFYFSLIMLWPYSAMFLVLLVAFDSLFDMRTRIGA